MKVVTSGYRYLDIDAYGGCVAYAELLKLQGEEAIAATTAPLNESITSTIKSWPVELVQDYTPAPADEFVLIDLSDPDVFDTFVNHDKIVEILDHHMEFADYWQTRLGDRAQIEFIGAACTLVYERWQRAEKLAHINETSARLLIAGILDNTLNFRASITTDRDRAAYAELMRYANLSADWPAQYFAECQQEMMNDLQAAIIHDIKIIEFPSLKRKIGTGQLVVWNAKDIASDHVAEIRDTMATTGAEWFMNIVSIEEGKNYLVAGNADMEQFLEKLLGVTFIHSVATTDTLWLRKEIMKKDLDSTK